MAKSENQLAVQTINAAWGGIGAGTGNSYSPRNVLGGRKKDADCRLEAAQVSLETTEIESARLACGTGIPNECTAWLQQVRSSELEPQVARPSYNLEDGGDDL